MFGVGFVELLVILCIGFILLKPSDLPTLAIYYKIITKKLFAIKKEVGGVFGSLNTLLLDEDKNKEETRMIKGIDGKMYESFDINELKPRRKRKIKEQK